jgi:DNA-binding MarR family transcriptional regulator
MGHVERSRHPSDRRSVRLMVTPSAKQLGLAFFGPLIGRILTAMTGFDDRETETIHRFLATIAETVPATR